MFGSDKTLNICLNILVINQFSIRRIPTWEAKYFIKTFEKKWETKHTFFEVLILHLVVYKIPVEPFLVAPMFVANTP